jgi:hypothetical protein
VSPAANTNDVFAFFAGDLFLQTTGSRLVFFGGTSQQRTFPE